MCTCTCKKVEVYSETESDEVQNPPKQKKCQGPLQRVILWYLHNTSNYTVLCRNMQRSIMAGGNTCMKEEMILVTVKTAPTQDHQKE